MADDWTPVADIPASKGANEWAPVADIPAPKVASSDDWTPVADIPALKPSPATPVPAQDAPAPDSMDVQHPMLASFLRFVEDPFKPDPEDAGKRDVPAGEAAQRAYIGAANAIPASAIEAAHAVVADPRVQNMLDPGGFLRLLYHDQGVHPVAALGGVGQRFQQEVDSNAQQPNERMGAGAKAASIAGNLGVQLPVMAATGGESAEGGGIVDAFAHGLRSSIVPAATAGVQTAHAVSQHGGSDPQAVTAGLVGAGTTAVLNALTMGQGGNLLARIIKGGAVMAAGGEAARRVNNLALPDDMQQQPETGANALTGAIINAFLGARAEPSDAAAAARVQDAADTLQKLAPAVTQRVAEPNTAPAETPTAPSRPAGTGSAGAAHITQGAKTEAVAAELARKGLPESVIQTVRDTLNSAQEPMPAEAVAPEYVQPFVEDVNRSIVDDYGGKPIEPADHAAAAALHDTTRAALESGATPADVLPKTGEPEADHAARLAGMIEPPKEAAHGPDTVATQGDREAGDQAIPEGANAPVYPSGDAVGAVSSEGRGEAAAVPEVQKVGKHGRRAAAVHTEDSGAQPEAATPEVIAQSAQHVERTPTVSMKDARANLLAQIDAAIVDAKPNEHYGIGSEVSNYRRTSRDVLAKIGMREFDVPGDGKFKVINTRERLQAFRDQVSSQFKKPANHPTPSYPSLKREDHVPMVKRLMASGDWRNLHEYSEMIGQPLRYGGGKGGPLALALAKDFTVDGVAFHVGLRDDGKWVATEPRSGLSLAEGKTPEETLRTATKRIHEKGADVVETAVKKAASDNNVIPENQRADAFARRMTGETFSRAAESTDTHTPESARSEVASELGHDTTAKLERNGLRFITRDELGRMNLSDAKGSLTAADLHGVRGLSQGGRADVVADNVPRGTAVKTVLHEVVHANLRRILGDAGVERVGNILRGLAKSNPELAKAIDAIHPNTRGKDFNEEVIAHAGEYLHDPRIWTKIKDKVAVGLAKLGFAPKWLDTHEALVREMVTQNLRHMAETEGRTFQMPEGRAPKAQIRMPLSVAQAHVVDQPQDKTAEAAQEATTGVKNAKVDEAREQRGAPELQTKPGTSKEDRQQNAHDTLAADPKAGEKLVDRILNEGHVPNQAETDLLNLHLSKANNAHDAAIEHVNNLPKNASDYDKAQAQIGLDEAHASLDRAEKAADLSGTELSRSFSARKPVVTKDGIFKQWAGFIRAKGGGSKLPDAKLEAIKRLTDQLHEAQRQLSEAMAQHAAKKAGARKASQDRYHSIRAKLLEIAKKPETHPVYQRVFHGTPHRGIEKEGFKLNKIGTGEGAQAYGYGMYFASQREVAEGYSSKLSEPVVTFGGVLARDLPSGRARDLGMWITSNVGVMQASARQAEANRLYRGLQVADKALLPEPEVTDNGQLYSAEIPEDSDLLDWDKPLSEQPEKVREALQRAAKDYHSEFNSAAREIVSDPSMTGKEIYETLHGGGRGFADADADAEIASRALLDMGIPGLRYLDGSSRGKGEGHHNYVIWDESHLNKDVTPYYSRADAIPSLVRQMAKELAAGGEHDPEKVIDTLHADIGPATGLSREQVRQMVTGEAQRNATRQKQLQGQIADKTARIDIGDFGKKPRPKFAYNEDTFALQQQANRISRKLQKLADAQEARNHSLPVRALAFLQKLKLLNILTSVSAFAKLPAAVAYRMAATPLEEAIGSVWRHMPVISKVAAKAPRQGQGFNAGAELAAIKGFLRSPLAMKDSLTKGYDKADDAFGTKYIHADDWGHWSGRIHQVLKQPAKQAEMERAYVLHSRFEYNKAFQAAKDQGASDEAAQASAQAHMDKPSVQYAVGTRAYANALEAIMQGDNKAVNAFRTFQHGLSQSSELGYVGSKILDFVQPILKVPANLVKETSSLTPLGFAKAKMRMRKGIKNMTPEDADYVMKNLKKGTLGTGLLTIGAYLFAQGILSGLPEDADRKEHKEGGGSEMLGLSKHYFESPQAQLLNMGASFARHYQQNGGGFDGALQAIGDVNRLYLIGDKHHYSAIPGLDTLQRYQKAYENAEQYDHRGAGEVIGSELRSSLVPAIVQQEAAGNEHYNAGKLQVPALADPYKGFRKPRNMLEDVMLGIPGLREQVPASKPHNSRKP